jgi:hypothetical protein
MDDILFSTALQRVLVVEVSNSELRRPVLGLTMSTGALTQKPDKLENEADHSPPSNVEVYNVLVFTSTPPLSVYGVVLTLSLTDCRQGTNFTELPGLFS